MFRAVFKERPDKRVVVTNRMWSLSAQPNDLPDHTIVEATVVFQSDNKTWELSCCMPPELTADAWLIVHAKHNAHVLGYFPLYHPNNTATATATTARSTPKPVQLVNSQPQQPPQTDILLFAVQTTNDCHDFNIWLYETGGYAACELFLGEPGIDHHLMIVRTLRNAALTDTTEASSMEQGNMLLTKTETANLLSRTKILQMTLKVVQWEFNMDTFAPSVFDNISVFLALEHQRAFWNSLPCAVVGNLEKPLEAVLPVTAECGRHAIYMAHLTLCCIANGCTNLTCLTCVNNVQSVVACVRKNQAVFQTEASANNFLCSPRSYDPDLFFSLVFVALQVPPESNFQKLYLPNVQRLLKLYLP